MAKTVSFSKNSLNIFFHILTNCNLSCRHCYINPDQHGTNTLPIRTIKTWLRIFAEKSRNANVIFLGGEPTLHPDLYLAIQEANEIGYKSVTIDTNGYLFHDILSKVLPDQVDFISFSLDGATRSTNDKIRGDGSYETCIDGIRQSVENGFNTSLIYTVSRDNMHELEYMPTLLKELNIQHFFIQVIGIRGRSAQNNITAGSKEEKRLQLTHDEWMSLVPGVAEEVASNKIKVTYPKVFLRPEEKFECGGLVSDNYFVFPNGRVYKCPLCEDFAFHSFEIGQDGLIRTKKINEQDMFRLNIPEGCVMNRLIQPDNITYESDGNPDCKIACCMLKEELN